MSWLDQSESIAELMINKLDARLFSEVAMALNGMNQKAREEFCVWVLNHRSREMYHKLMNELEGNI